jgi:hypothetical protein
MKEFILEEFKTKNPEKKVFMISSASREGIDELVDFLIDSYTTKIEDDLPENEVTSDLTLFDLKDSRDPRKVKVKYLGETKFKAT